MTCVSAMSSTKFTKLMRPVIIGMVGGIAAGKSYVGELLENKGALRIDADRLGHEVLLLPEVRERLVELWGKDILDAQGQVQRAAIAALVFGTSAEAVTRRRQLEEIVHPRSRRLAEQRIAAARVEPEVPMAIVIDAPLLIEAGWEPFCDLILFIDAPYETRLARAQQRGWTQQQFDDRATSQLGLSEKRSAATHIIDSRGETELNGQINRLWKQISQSVV